MFRRSRRKIVAAIMGVLVGLFLLLLAVIYTTSYLELSEGNYAMLRGHAQMYVLAEHVDRGEALPPGWMEPLPGAAPGGPHFEPDHVFRASTFYSVAVGEDGRVLAAETGDYDPQALQSLALELLAQGRSQGKQGSLLYHVEQKAGYRLVAFMDNSLIHRSMHTLLRNSLLGGAAALGLFFLLALYLARRIVGPLEESYRRQKQFISDAGHELKTPLAVVSASAELLGRRLGEDPWLANIQYENQRMGQLVSQLLELARAEDRKPELQRLDLSRLVTADALPFEALAFEKGLELALRVSPEIWLRGCPRQLSQLVGILLDNAISHSRGPGRVELELTESRGHALLQVTNPGPAIDPAQLPLLFERFYRADEARSGQGRHYGLGLSIARAIVTAHQGRIEVSCPPGRVCFRVRLPKN